jgi:hypothetical protein
LRCTPLPWTFADDRLSVRVLDLETLMAVKEETPAEKHKVIIARSIEASRRR